MHPIFSVTLFTGQQLVLEVIQRWLTRPCADLESQRARRTGLKGLISLLIKTTATGVLATVLDAAIEFRRRQLLAAAAEPEDGGAAASRFPGLGMLSRAGIASWKARLLLCIDELERRAEAYGIESRHRFSPAKSGGEAARAGGKGGPASGRGSAHASCADLGAQGGEEDGAQCLGRTVEQLRDLVKQGDVESQRRLDDEVGSLVDLLLGTATLPSTTAAAPSSAAACRSRSVPAALDSLGGRRDGGAGCGCMRACRSRPALAEAPTEACDEVSEPGSPTAWGGDLCQICMDRRVDVQVAGCQHDLCFGCARRLCASQDHDVPQCPFCRQTIEGFVPILAAAHAAASTRSALDAAVGAVVARA